MHCCWTCFPDLWIWNEANSLEHKYAFTDANLHEPKRFFIEFPLRLANPKRQCTTCKELWHTMEGKVWNILKNWIFSSWTLLKTLGVLIKSLQEQWQQFPLDRLVDYMPKRRQSVIEATTYWNIWVIIPYSILFPVQLLNK